MRLRQAIVMAGFLMSGLVGCESQREDPTSLALNAVMPRCENGFFRQTNLVSDEPGVAPFQDATLIKAWGISSSPTGGAFSVSVNATGISGLYSGDVNGNPIARNLAITIPAGAPTGQVLTPARTSWFFKTRGPGRLYSSLRLRRVRSPAGTRPCHNQ